MTKCMIFSNITGVYVFSEDFSIIKQYPTSNLDIQAMNILEWSKTELKAIDSVKNKKVFFIGIKSKKIPNVILSLDPKKLSSISDILYREKRTEIHQKNIDISSIAVADSVKEDTEIIKAMHAFDDIARYINSLLKRLADWFELFDPETAKSLRSDPAILEKVKNFKPQERSLLGAEPDKAALRALDTLAVTIEDNIKYHADLEAYISEIVKKTYPNLFEVAGPLITARLISLAGSIKHLAELPATTVQLLGAEKALFRHMRSGAKPPKHGIIIQHPFVESALRKDRGRHSRILADAISIAARVDYYKGEYIADKLKKKMKRRIR